MNIKMNNTINCEIPSIDNDFFDVVIFRSGKSWLLSLRFSSFVVVFESTTTKLLQKLLHTRISPIRILNDTCSRILIKNGSIYSWKSEKNISTYKKSYYTTTTT